MNQYIDTSKLDKEEYFKYLIEQKHKKIINYKQCNSITIFKYIIVNRNTESNVISLITSINPIPNGKMKDIRFEMINKDITRLKLAPLISNNNSSNRNNIHKQTHSVTKARESVYSMVSDKIQSQKIISSLLVEERNEFMSQLNNLRLNKYNLESKACIKIQASYRGYLTRYKLNNIKNNLIIYKNIRSKLINHLLKQDIKIQSLQQYRLEYKSKINKAAVNIQCSFRVYISKKCRNRKRFLYRYNNRLQAIITIQCIIRIYLSKCKVFIQKIRHQIVKRLNACIKIQCFFRRLISYNKMINKLKIINKDYNKLKNRLTVKVSKYNQFRSTIITNRCISKNVIIIQCFIRKLIAKCKVNRLMYNYLTNRVISNVITIQSIIRKFIAYRKVLKLKYQRDKLVSNIDSQPKNQSNDNNQSNDYDEDNYFDDEYDDEASIKKEDDKIIRSEENSLFKADDNVSIDYTDDQSIRYEDDRSKRLSIIDDDSLIKDVDDHQSIENDGRTKNGEVDEIQLDNEINQQVDVINNPISNETIDNKGRVDEIVNYEDDFNDEDTSTKSINKSVDIRIGQKIDYGSNYDHIVSDINTSDYRIESDSKLNDRHLIDDTDLNPSNDIEQVNDNSISNHETTTTTNERRDSDITIDNLSTRRIDNQQKTKDNELIIYAYDLTDKHQSSKIKSINPVDELIENKSQSISQIVNNTSTNLLDNANELINLIDSPISDIYSNSKEVYEDVDYKVVNNNINTINPSNAENISHRVDNSIRNENRDSNKSTNSFIPSNNRDIDTINNSSNESISPKSSFGILNVGAISNKTIDIMNTKLQSNIDINANNSADIQLNTNENELATYEDDFIDNDLSSKIKYNEPINLEVKLVENENQLLSHTVNSNKSSKELFNDNTDDNLRYSSSAIINESIDLIKSSLSDNSDKYLNKIDFEVINNKDDHNYKHDSDILPHHFDKRTNYSLGQNSEVSIGSASSFPDHDNSLTESDKAIETQTTKSKLNKSISFVIQEILDQQILNVDDFNGVSNKNNDNNSNESDKVNDYHSNTSGRTPNATVYNEHSIKEDLSKELDTEASNNNGENEVDIHFSKSISNKNSNKPDNDFIDDKSSKDNESNDNSTYNQLIASTIIPSTMQIVSEVNNLDIINNNDNFQSPFSETNQSYDTLYGSSYYDSSYTYTDSNDSYTSYTNSDSSSSLSNEPRDYHDNVNDNNNGSYRNQNNESSVQLELFDNNKSEDVNHNVTTDTNENNTVVDSNILNNSSISKRNNETRIPDML